MKRLDLVQRLEQTGCILFRHGSRHDIYHNIYQQDQESLLEITIRSQGLEYLRNQAVYY